ncbi:MAG: hypothetical protein NW241_03740 [Bacteroidia bacterium]|nr:hypothetical protein [Bacteroidia bacterium]
MRLLRPFSLPDEEGAAAYARHRQAERFAWVLGEGIRQVADAHAEKINTTIREVGGKLDHTIREGFSEQREYNIEIHRALIDQTQVLYRGFRMVEVQLESGFGQTALALSEVSGRIENLGMTLVETGDRLAQGIAGLKAAFDMGLAGLVSQAELQRSEIRAGFDRLSHLLENTRKTEAQERYRDGQLEYERYLRHPDEPRFLDDALHYLTLSEAVYRGNPFCHLYLGHIRHEAGHLYDPAAVRDHYLACAAYAKGLEDPALAALGYFFAAWMQYVLGDLEGAIRSGEQSLACDPDRLPENYYHLARFYARRGDAAQAIARLDTAVRRFDPAYALKSALDADFAPVRSDLDAYFERIRREAAERWDHRLTPLRKLGTSGPETRKAGDGSHQR